VCVRALLLPCLSGVGAHPHALAWRWNAFPPHHQPSHVPTHPQASIPLLPSPTCAPTTGSTARRRARTSRRSAHRQISIPPRQCPPQVPRQGAGQEQAGGAAQEGGGGDCAPEERHQRGQRAQRDRGAAQGALCACIPACVHVYGLCAACGQRRLSWPYRWAGAAMAIVKIGVHEQLDG